MWTKAELDDPRVRCVPTSAITGYTTPSGNSKTVHRVAELGPPSYTRVPFVCPAIPESLDSLKLAALYFDQVPLRQKYLIKSLDDKTHGKTQSLVLESIPVVSATFLREIFPLVRENVVVLEEPICTASQAELYQKIWHRVCESITLLADKVDGHTITLQKDVVSVHEQVVGPLAPGHKLYLEALYGYYAELLAEVATDFLRGQPVIVNSSIVQRFFDHFLTSGVIQSEAARLGAHESELAKFGCDILAGQLIDVSQLSFEQILEARSALKDELIAFRAEVRSLHEQISNDLSPDEFKKFGSHVAQERIQPKLKELERKISLSKVGILQRVLEVARRPDAYTPLLLSWAGVCSLPTATTISGIIAMSEIGAAIYKEKIESRGNGLMYVFKLRQRMK